MIDILWNFIVFIIVLGIFVVVYEFGYFWVVRCCGVKVEKFFIGFGKLIWKCVGYDGIEYLILMILFGGYVKMFDGCVDDVFVE